MFEQWHPLGRGRRHQRVQLPRRGVELERGARRGLRRQHAVEAVGKDAADGDRGDQDRGRRSAARTASIRPSSRSSSARARPIGERLLHDQRIPLVSATGSRRGWDAGSPRSSASASGRTILELGGNNAIIVTPNANLDLALPAILFGAVGTAGQRCTSTRRIIVHESVKDELVSRLVRAYRGRPHRRPAADRYADGTARQRATPSPTS